jgi:rubrerythrin
MPAVSFREDKMASSEQARVVAGLATAIKMEIDGKVFYLKASAASKSKEGKKLLSQLADEEDTHRETFEQIYEAIRRRQLWPDLKLKPSAGVKTLFSPCGPVAELSGRVLADEISAVKTALSMEIESYDFYESRIKTASCDLEAQFYKAIAAQEKEHHLVLLDYLEFLEDPSAYFTKTEHPSLDGG